MTKGEKFTRQEISKLLGGSPVQFAPTKDNEITCLCLDPERHPTAPRAVFAGVGKGNEKMRDLLIAHEGPLPTFIKRTDEEWEYVGDYEVAGHSFEKDEIDRRDKSGTVDLAKVSAVVMLKKEGKEDILGTITDWFRSVLPGRMVAQHG